MGYELKKIKGGWAIVETRVIEICPDKKEATTIINALEKKDATPISFSFCPFARRNGKYTTYVVLPSKLVHKFAICPGDKISLSLNVVVHDNKEDDTID